MTMIPQHVLDAADVSAVTQLTLLERDCRDHGRWDSMLSCFHEDSRVNLSWFNGSGRDFVAASREMARKGVAATHRLGPPLVRLARDRAVATFGGVIDIPVTVDGVEALLSSHARFVYRTERRGQTWRIFAFDAVYMRDEIVPSIPGQVLRIPASELAQLRSSYRMLSYVLTREGYAVNAELAGEDRPESVRSLELEVFGWAGIQAPS
jgi:SnoaL-like domain